MSLELALWLYVEDLSEEVVEIEVPRIVSWREIHSEKGTSTAEAGILRLLNEEVWDDCF